MNALGTKPEALLFDIRTLGRAGLVKACIAALMHCFIDFVATASWHHNQADNKPRNANYNSIKIGSRGTISRCLAWRILYL